MFEVQPATWVTVPRLLSPPPCILPPQALSLPPLSLLPPPLIPFSFVCLVGWLAFLLLLLLFICFEGHNKVSSFALLNAPTQMFYILTRSKATEPAGHATRPQNL